MRSSQRSLIVVAVCLALVLSSLLIGTAARVQAADPTSVALSSSDGSPATLTQISGHHIGTGAFTADVNMYNSAVVSFDTQQTLGKDCASLAVYRMTEVGDLLWTPESCSGNQLTITGLGGSFNVDYWIASFGSADAANNAPQLATNGTY